MSEKMVNQPFDIELERMVLGGIIHEPNQFKAVAHILEPEHFHDPKHKEVYKAIIDVVRDGNTPDLIHVTYKLKERVETALKWILEITDMATYIADKHAKFIYQLWQERERIRIVTEAAMSGDTDSVPLKLEELNRDWQKKKPLKSFSSVLSEVESHIEKAMQTSSAVTGITTGNYDLNTLTGGWQPGDLIVLAGRPGMGKTARALNFMSCAVEDGKHCLFMSYEMSDHSIVKRILSERSGIPVSSIHRGTITHYDQKVIKEITEMLRKYPVTINDNSRTGIYDLTTRCKLLKSIGQLDILIVDYLQIIPSAGVEKTNNRSELIGKFTIELKTLAKECGIPVILLAQLNRSGESQGDRRPDLHQLRESGNIEQDADMVCFIYRPSYYTKGDQSKENDANLAALDSLTYDQHSELIIAKNRNGKLATIVEYFDGSRQRFTNDPPTQSFTHTQAAPF